MTPSRGSGSRDADYEGFWERRFREQHRTLHGCEDDLATANTRIYRVRTHVTELRDTYKELGDQDKVAILEEILEEFK